MIYSTPSALSVTWHTIAGVACARLHDPAVVDTRLRPVLWLHGRRPDAANLWGEIAAWTNPAILPGALWAVLASGRTAFVPWVGHHYGHDAAGLDDARALLAEVGPVDLIGYSMGGLGACALSATDPGWVATVTLVSPCVDLVACLDTLDPVVAAEARAVWTGDPDASDAAVTAALEAAGRDPAGLAAGFRHADRCVVLSGTNDPHLGDTVGAWAAAAGVPAEARYLAGPGNHYNAAATDPEWDDIMPLRLAAATPDPDPPDPEPV